MKNIYYNVMLHYHYKKTYKPTFIGY